MSLWKMEKFVMRSGAFWVSCEAIKRFALVDDSLELDPSAGRWSFIGAIRHKISH